MIFILICKKNVFLIMVLLSSSSLAVLVLLLNKNCGLGSIAGASLHFAKVAAYPTASTVPTKSSLLLNSLKPGSLQISNVNVNLSQSSESQSQSQPQTPAEDRLFFPPYKFPFWGLPYGIWNKGGFFNPGLFPFVPGSAGFPPYDGIFGGPEGPGQFPGPGPTPFQSQINDTTHGGVGAGGGGLRPHFEPIPFNDDDDYEDYGGYDDNYDYDYEEENSAPTTGEAPNMAYKKNDKRELRTETKSDVPKSRKKRMPNYQGRPSCPCKRKPPKCKCRPRRRRTTTTPAPPYEYEDPQAYMLDEPEPAPYNYPKYMKRPKPSPPPKKNRYKAKPKPKPKPMPDEDVYEYEPMHTEAPQPKYRYRYRYRTTTTTPAPPPPPMHYYEVDEPEEQHQYTYSFAHEPPPPPPPAYMHHQPYQTTTPVPPPPPPPPTPHPYYRYMQPPPEGYQTTASTTTTTPAPPTTAPPPCYMYSGPILVPVPCPLTPMNPAYMYGTTTPSPTTTPEPGYMYSYYTTAPTTTTTTPPPTTTEYTTTTTTPAPTTTRPTTAPYNPPTYIFKPQIHTAPPNVVIMPIRDRYPATGSYSTYSRPQPQEYSSPYSHLPAQGPPTYYHPEPSQSPTPYSYNANTMQTDYHTNYDEQGHDSTTSGNNYNYQEPVYSYTSTSAHSLLPSSYEQNYHPKVANNSSSFLQTYPVFQPSSQKQVQYPYDNMMTSSSTMSTMLSNGWKPRPSAHSPIMRRSTDEKLNHSTHYNGGTHLSGPMHIYLGSNAHIFLANAMHITGRNQSDGFGHGMGFGNSGTASDHDAMAMAMPGPMPMMPSPAPAAPPAPAPSPTPDNVSRPMQMAMTAMSTAPAPPPSSPSSMPMSTPVAEVTSVVATASAPPPPTSTTNSVSSSSPASSAEQMSNADNANLTRMLRSSDYSRDMNIQDMLPAPVPSHSFTPAEAVALPSASSSQALVASPGVGWIFSTGGNPDHSLIAQGSVQSPYYAKHSSYETPPSPPMRNAHQYKI